MSCPTALAPSRPSSGERSRWPGGSPSRPANSYGLAGGTELGYRLYPAFWGRGLATEGARALIASAFERLHLDRVVATTMAVNAGSWRVLEKCGLRRVKTFYYPDADLMPGAEHGDFISADQQRLGQAGQPQASRARESRVGRDAPGNLES